MEYGFLLVFTIELWYYYIIVYIFNKSLFSTFDARSHLVAVLTAVFALVYHTGFLITFYFLHIREMVIFNIFSVVLFAIITLLKYSQSNLLFSYLVSFVEVILHQLFAMYFIGFSTSFHFLIIIMGLLPFILFNTKFQRSAFFGFASIGIFILIYVFEDFFKGIYILDTSVITVIKLVNISVSLCVIVCVIMLFTQIVLNDDEKFESEINRIRMELMLQSNKVIKLQKNTIIRLANLVENRDSDTGQHVKRTSAYVKIIAKQAMEDGLYSSTLNENYIELLYNAAPMHDIGKIVVSDSILKKPGKLTDEEFLEMQKHAIEGKKIIEQILFDSDDVEYLKIATEIACYHHEKWDGSGYPEHRKDFAIPLSARIMAIADVYDALVSPRCYKAPMPVEQAFNIIESEKGKHFDPELVKVFMKLKDKIISIQL